MEGGGGGGVESSRARVGSQLLQGAIKTCTHGARLGDEAKYTAQNDSIPGSEGFWRIRAPQHDAETSSWRTQMCLREVSEAQEHLLWPQKMLAPFTQL